MEPKLNIDPSFPKTTILTKGLFAHGGLYRPLKKEVAKSVFASMIQTDFFLDDNQVLNDLETNAQDIIDNFFFRIVNHQPYEFTDELIKYLTDKQKGILLSIIGDNGFELLEPNQKIPTFMVFVGQFIDHDITLNPITLIGRGGQSGNINGASALIDLDTVYGGEDRIELIRGDLWSMVNNTNGQFKLRKVEKNIFDLPRNNKNEAYIFDARNDENQIILQIHILIMRLHNVIAEKFEKQPDPNNPDEVKEFYYTVKEEVLKIWQSFIYFEYLPAIVAESPLKWAIENLGDTPEQFGMSHEFAIAYRMGHSQLRPFYRLNPGNSIVLFDPNTNGDADLRGGKPLSKEHGIDWKFFIDDISSNQVSNKINTKITRRVFELPDSAIPDENKQINNLPERNLLRSIQVGISSAEEIAKHLGIPIYKILTPEQIEPDKDKRELFTKDGEFKTPLWYYVLKEAEIQNKGAQLGELGGRIIAKQLLGGIYFQKDCFLNNDWKSLINGTSKVTFKEIINYITEI